MQSSVLDVDYLPSAVTQTIVYARKVLLMTYLIMIKQIYA